MDAEAYPSHMCTQWQITTSGGEYNFTKTKIIILKLEPWMDYRYNHDTHTNSKHQKITYQRYFFEIGKIMQ